MRKSILIAEFVRRMTLVTLSALLAFSALGDTLSSQTETKTETVTSKHDVNYPTITVAFTKGSGQLTPAMKNELRQFIHKARSNAKIDTVYVAAWSDRERAGDESLPDADQDLAGQRTKNIRKYLETDFKVDVDTFNMAKRANFFNRALHAEDAKVKGDVTTDKSDPVAAHIQNNAKPSAAVCVVETERTIKTKTLSE